MLVVVWAGTSLANASIRFLVSLASSTDLAAGDRAAARDWWQETDKSAPSSVEGKDACAGTESVSLSSAVVLVAGAATLNHISVASVSPASVPSARARQRQSAERAQALRNTCS